MSAKERLATKIKNKNKNTNSTNKNIKPDDINQTLAYLALVLEQYQQQNNLPIISNDENIKSHDNNNLNYVGEQIALLIVGAISFIVAFAWNELLKNLQGNTFKQEPFYNLIYVIGITILAAVIIYYITVLVEQNNH